MEHEMFKRLCQNVKKRLSIMPMYEQCELADELDPVWYADWGEREGADEELTAYLYELLK